MIYLDKKGVLQKLINDENYESLVEVYDEDRFLAAGLFIRKEGRCKDGQEEKRIVKK